MKPDGVLIDISRLLTRAARGRLPTGIDRVCLEYIKRWGARAQAVIHMGGWRRVASYDHSQALFDLLLARPMDFSRRVASLVARICMPLSTQQDAGGKLAFYLGHSGVHRDSFAGWIKATHQRPIYFVHDLIPIMHAEYCRAGEQAKHIQRMRTMLVSGAGLIGNSQDTLDETDRFAHEQSLPMPPSVVALLASAPLTCKADTPSPLAVPYFVMLGTIEPRKNHLLVLNVWRDMVQRLGNAAPHLVLIGQRGWECENVIDILERCTSLWPFVHEVGTCSDEALVAYLQHARALLFPSFVEGFGMPLVEALSLGTPVIASDINVFREVAADAPDYLSPIDALGWMHAIEDYVLLDSRRRAEQLRRMENYVAPTWSAHFDCVDALLERLT